MCVRILTPLMIAIGLAGPQAAVPAGPRAAGIAWLAGCWEHTSARALTQEQWMAPAGGVMIGMARTIAEGREASHEYLRIDERDGALVYTALPSGQDRTSFRETVLEPSRVVFENLAHDFPQRVSYTLRDDGSLLARVEGGAGGSSRAIDFEYRRVGCPDGGAARPAVPGGSGRKERAP